ncbi:MAG: hypothetical protein NTW04_05510 [Elusimicrobia bacterium]|nr:hypothetical protein [Elusimicrobiota bacterium]
MVIPGGVPSGKSSGRPKAPHTIAELERGIYDELERLKTEPVEQYEIEKAANNIEAGIVSQMESNLDMANELSYWQSLAGDWRRSWKFVDEIKKVTADDIKRVAAQYFVAEKRTVVWVEKKTEKL